MRTCYLHLGMPKTGSSSIQDAFFRYDREGIAYAKLRQKNHGLPLAAVFSENPASLREFRWRETSDEERTSTISKMREQIEKVCNGNQSIIFSGEAIIDQLKPREFGALVERMKSSFDQVIAIAYVRPLASLVSSQTQQRIRMGMSNFSLPAPDYRRRFEPVIDYVGRDKCILVRFERDDLIGGDIVTDFASRVGVKEVPCRRAPTNESMSAEALGALFAFNRFTGPLLRLKDRTRIRREMEVSLRGVGRTKFGLDPLLIEEHIERHREDVAWIEDVCHFDLKGKIVPVSHPIKNHGQLLRLAAQSGRLI